MLVLFVFSSSRINKNVFFTLTLTQIDVTVKAIKFSEQKIKHIYTTLKD